MIHLSVNVNKIATLRNSRGTGEPSVLQAVQVALDAGAPGVTVHPRADERHIRRTDVLEIAAFLDRRHAALGGSARAEFNIEGDPRPDLIDLVLRVRPTQCTLVPVMPGEVTSQAGWPATTDPSHLRRVIGELRAAGVRVSVFIDPQEAAVRWAASLGAHRVELFTEPFAHAFARGEADGASSFATYVAASRLAHALGLGVNAGHDLNLDNLVLFRSLPHLDEVSIGHALVTRALWVGLDRTVRDYLEVLAPAG